jgi:hypothetical protein
MIHPHLEGHLHMYSTQEGRWDQQRIKTKGQLLKSLSALDRVTAYRIVTDTRAITMTDETSPGSRGSITRIDD